MAAATNQLGREILENEKCEVISKRHFIV